MPRHRSLRWAPLIILLMLAAPAIAHAQDPPECPDDSSSQSSGQIVGINLLEFPIDLAPCQTVNISVTTSDNHPWWGAAFKIQLCNTPTGQQCDVPSHTELYTEYWSILNNPVTVSSPNSAPWLWPYRGTRGTEGLPKRAVFGTISNVAGTISYQITISKVKRPDYNIGGSNPGNAPLVTFGTVYKGSIHPYEPGQYFKVHLEPNQGFGVAGTMLAHYPYGPYWEINIVDASNTFVQRIGFGATSGGPKPFYTNVYSNSTGAPQDLIVQFWCQYYPIHDFQIVFDAPKLTLYLDADNNFNVDSPQDDSPDYSPCATLDGKSLPLTQCPQTVKVIAGYTIGGVIVKVPTAGAVNFALQDTSAFTGVAMNYGTGTEADYVFAGNVSSVAVSFGFWDRTVSVDLISRDYGGLTTVKANNAVEMKVPRRTDLVPDKWKVYPTPLTGPAETVNGSGRAADADDDANPSVQGPPMDPEGRGLVGDGITVFEEFRGFVQFDNHARTHPDKKDLFIAGDDGAGGLGFGYAGNLPLTLHHVCDPSVALGCGVLEYSSTRVVNANRANALGNPIAGQDQRGVRLSVLQQAIDPLLGGCTFGFTWGIGYPVPLNINFTGVTEMTPNETLTVEVYRQPHEVLGDPVNFNNCGPGDLPRPLSAAEVQGAISMTMGHEVGHAVHICHTGDTQSGGIAYDCPGGAVLLLPPILSVMHSGIRLPIPNQMDSGAQYSPSDAAQIRLHVRQ